MNFEELLKDPATKVTATTVGVVAIVIGILGKDVSGDQISDCLRIILFVLGSVVFLTGLSVTRYWARDANGNLTGKGQLVSGIAFGLGLVLLAGIGIGALVRNLGSEDRTTEVVNALGDYVESLQGTDAAKQQTAGYSVF